MVKRVISPVVVRRHFGNDYHASSAVAVTGQGLVIVPIIGLGVFESEPFLNQAFRKLYKDEDPFSSSAELSQVITATKYSIIFPENKEYTGVATLVFSSKTIRNSFEDLFRRSPSIKLSKSDSFSVAKRAVLLSSFLVLRVVEEIEQSSLESYSIPGDSSEFSVVAAPYGHVLMQGSTFACRLANIINVLYLLDKPLAKGCEGGLLLSSSADPIGVVLATTFDTKDQNINLTLAGDIREILRGTFMALKMESTVDISESALISRDSALKYVCLVESGRGSYGSGALLKIGQKRLILTCSHVVTSDNENVCTWNGMRLSIKLVYKNPKLDYPFDVAVFEAPKEIPKSAFCTSSKSNPIVGSTIKAVGFPIFDPSTVASLGILPSVYTGRLVHYRAGMILADSVIQSGQSGGPIFNERNEIVGIAISNFRENDTGRVFPSLSCCVPMFNIMPFLAAYCESGDPNELRKLEGSEYLRRLWNFEEPILRGKL